MSDRDLLPALRRAWADAEATRHRLGVGVAVSEEELAAAIRAGDSGAADVARLERDELRRQRAEATEQLATLAAQIEQARDDFDPATFPDLADRITVLGADLPVALLPVRIETRFLPHGQAPPTHLWIRIYPDDIHIHSHEPELTAGEIAVAEEYWTAVAEAQGDAAAIDAAWSRLAEAYDPNRAEWIARATRPGADGLPRLDEVPRREGAWTRAPVARALPERFVALGYVAGQRVFTEWGEQVPERVAAGPEPELDADDTVERIGPPPADQTELPLDDGMRWLVDLEEAKRLGMAISVELRPEFASGLDRLIVLGVRSADDPTATAALLADQLQSHRFTEGLAVLGPAAPTNNTSTERSAATSERPRADPLRMRTPAGPGTVGAATVTALGLDPGTTDDVAGADRVDRHAEMHAALWPATLGYYAEQLLLPLLTDRIVDGLHDHFVGYVRGRGPLPALRIGNQPYGLLPVVAPGRLGSDGPDLSQPLESFLLRIRGFWSSAARSMPRLGRTGDAVRDLIEVLGLAPTTESVDGRPVVGRHLLENLFRHGVASPIPEAGMEAQRVLAEMLLNGVGIRDRTIRLASTASIDARYPIRRPLVARGVLSESEPAPFVADLAAELGHADSLQRLRSLPAATSLLDLLLRQAAVVSMGGVATALNLVARGRPSRVLMEAEFVDVDTRDDATATPLRLVSRPVDGVTDGRTVAEVIATGDGGLQQHLRAWNEFRAGLEALAKIPAAELHRLFVDLLDVLSHRLDAWFTSLATRRLEQLRAATPTGVHLGAFGFVEDVRPLAPESVLVGEDGEVVVELAGNQGYVHAPSLAHASTAAILRSGFLAHGGSRDEVLALDLSSARVRRALEVIQGVRQGERLGAVLGYRIERAMGERELGQYIRPLRTAAPLVVEVTGSIDQIEAAIGGSVVDGERAVAMAQQGELFGAPPRPFPNDDPNRAAVEAVIAEAADIVDALADLLLAESVHQVVRGDTASASAALAAVDDGATPPDPDIAHTPRTGVGLSHRLVALFDPAAGPAPGWSSRPRSLAEPGVDRWVGSLLGPPDRVRVDVRYLPENGGEPVRSSFSLADIELAAVDVINGLQRGAHGEASEFEARLLRHAATLRPGTPELVLEPDNTSSGPEVPLAELVVLAEQLARVVARARPAVASDLAAVDKAGAPDGIEASSLRQRAEAAESAFRAAATALHEAVTTGDPAEVERTAAAFADFGVPGSLAGGASVLGHVDVLLAKLDADGLPVDAPTESVVARLELLFAGTVRVMPAFRMANAAELASSRAQSTVLQNGDPLRAAAWLGQLGLVREGVERFAQAVLMAETIAGARPGAEFRVVQLPHVPGDRWVTLELPDDRVPTASLAVVLHDADEVDVSAPIAGCVIDDWHEVVPRGSEISGVSLHYDQPDATAPNAILIGIHPGAATTWDLEALEATVVESIELAKVRTVDTDGLQWLARFLPLLYFPDNLSGDTAAVDLLRMAERDGD
jgi:hypothetical protein